MLTLLQSNGKDPCGRFYFEVASWQKMCHSQLCSGLSHLQLRRSVQRLESRPTVEARTFRQRVSGIYPAGHLRPGGDPLTQISQHPNDDHAGLQPVGTRLHKNRTLVGKPEGRMCCFWFLMTAELELRISNDLEPLGMAESSQVLQAFLPIQQIRRIHLSFICRGKKNNLSNAMLVFLPQLHTLQTQKNKEQHLNVSYGTRQPLARF